MNSFILPETTAEHRRDLRREAARAHLDTVARCCKPSEIRRLVSSLRDRTPGHRGARG
jgi:hypothetical protein